MHRRAAPLLSAGLALIALAAAAPSCAQAPDGPSLARSRRAALHLGDRVPDTTEREAVGALVRPIARGSAAFARLVRCDDPRIVFKDEERTGADRMMTPRLRERLTVLAARVRQRWPDLQLRVTEAWDEDREHGEASVHYEGRAADVTTSDLDPDKLGELAWLAVGAELDWVYFENGAHVHVSVTR